MKALIAILLAACALPRAAMAQTRPIVARDADARMEQLADGVFAIIHDDATTDWESQITEWPHGNSGVIVGDDAVLVVDATYLPSRARADIALIRAVTDKPVRYLVNTHWHGDHTHGNGVYLDSFPGIAIIGAEPTRDWIATMQRRYPAVVAQGGGKQATLARLTGMLDRGRDSSGKALSADQKKALAENIRRRQVELDEFTRIPIVPPAVLFDQSMVIYVGGKRVELQNWGRANSPADVSIYLPEEKVLFAGDIVVYPVPFVFAAHPLPWIDVLEGLERYPLVAMVPGHGPVMSDYAYARLVRELFEATRDRVRVLEEQGRQLDEIVKAVDLADFRRRFLEIDVPNIEAYWDGTPAILVERMHQCVQGYRC